MTLLLVAIISWILAYFRARLWVWTVCAALTIAVWYHATPAGAMYGPYVASLAMALALILNLTVLRRAVLSRQIFKLFKHILPPLSETEREALEAGTVGWDGELFSGNSNWRKLLAIPVPGLTPAEQALLDGPVEELCRTLDDWRIVELDKDLPPHVWQFLKQHRFFGMIIPPEYGGLGFSSLAHFQVIMKISSRSITAAVTAMVPNSLGPAELLLHYGTRAQKDHYLPMMHCTKLLPPRLWERGCVRQPARNILLLAMKSRCCGTACKRALSVLRTLKWSKAPG
jgi:acyl-CoA dehydrogenase